MADLSITAASVLPGSDASVDVAHTAGATITQGQAVYWDTTASNWKLADNDSGTTAAHGASGIAVNSAAAGQPLAVQKSGSITIGATLTAGVEYYLSANAGGICPAADLTTGKSVCLIGAALSTTLLALNFKNTGVTN